MRVLVLHQHYWPEIAATAQILSDLCEELAAAGHDVTVFTGQPSYRQLEGASRALPTREEHAGVRIRRLWSHVPHRRTVPHRLVHYGSFFLSSLAASLREARPDVVLIMSTPPLLLGVSAALLRLLRGVPFVYSVQDLYPDIAVDLGVLRPGPVTETVERLARRLYRAAAEVVTLSPAMAERLTAKGVPSTSVSVIPNWADTDAVTPLPRDNPFARAHGLADRFVIQYSGNIGLSQGLEHLPEVAARTRDMPVLFAVFGDGNARERLQREVQARGLQNVRLFPPQPRSRLAELLSSADVGLVTMRRGVARDLVPSKLYGIMAAGRPVLAAVEPGSEVARVVERHGCGRVVPAEEPAQLAAAIRELAANRPELQRWGEAGRAACEARFSRKACASLYEQVLHRAARGTSSTAAARGRGRAARAPRAKSILVSGGLADGGVSTHVRLLVAALRRAGHNVAVAATGTNWPEMHLAELRATGATVVAGRFGFGRLGVLGKLEAALTWPLRLGQVDVVYCLGHGWAHHLALRQQCGGGCSLYHEVADVPPAGHPVNRLARRVDGIIGCSERITRGWQQLAPRKPTATLPFLTYQAPVVDRVPRAPGAPLRMAYLGRLVRHKGVEWLLERWASIVRHVGPARLDVWGGDYGGERLLEPLRRYVEEQGLGSTVTLHGPYRSQTELARILAETDLVVLPSSYEGLPLTLVEAMLQGVPVAATSAGGCGEFATDNPDVCISPGTDREAFLEALLRFARHVEAGGVNPQRLRRWAEARYGRPGVERRWLELMEQPLETLRSARE